MLLSSDLILIIFILIFGWLGMLSFFVIRFLKSFQKLTKGVSEKDIKTLLGDVLKEIEMAKKEQGEITKEVEKQQEESKFFFQKAGLVRYNPFSDTGGDQSFVLALLDGNDNGFVLTSLHGRDQTRIFSKPINNGKESGYEFSKEEIAAIVKAKKGK